MASVGSAFAFDTTELRKEALRWGTYADRWLMNELAESFIAGGKIAQQAANRLITGGEASKLAQASTVTQHVAGHEIATVVSWDEARSKTGFPYAAAVDRGRKGFGPVTAKVLRFEVGGEIVFAKYVGPAPAQDFTGRGRAASEPGIVAEINKGIGRWADRMQAAS